MKLGGGLGTAIVKRADRKATTSHRLRRAPATHFTAYRIDDESPIALVALSLDHTGFNIGNLGAHAGAR